MLRRTCLLGLGCAGVAGRAAVRSAGEGSGLPAALAALEARIGGRIGFALLDTRTHRRTTWRGDERFPMCSTFKFLLAAAILARIDHGADHADLTVPIAAADIVGNSPFTETRVGLTATVEELCAAAMTRSDNAAANLLLPRIGGPAGLTRFARTLHDPVTRLDRIEPFLNEAVPGDARDTTTPRAMLGCMERLLLGDALMPRARAGLLAWMVATRTGTGRMRAGLPPGWRLGDRTGAGERGSDNEIAIVWPPRRAPVLIATYLTGSGRPLEETNAAHAAIGRLLGEAFAA